MASYEDSIADSIIVTDSIGFTIEINYADSVAVGDSIVYLRSLEDGLFTDAIIVDDNAVIERTTHGALSAERVVLGDSAQCVLICYASLNLSLPALTISARSGAIGRNLTLPALQITARATYNPIARLNRSLPRIVISALAHVDGVASLNASLPALVIQARASSSPIATLRHGTLPALQIKAHAISGMVASLNKSIGALTLKGSAYWIGPATLNRSLPALTIRARARGTVKGLVINTKNFALTEYSNFNYNSLCYFNGVLLGAVRTGIYKLAGDTDDGTEIPWSIKLGLLDLKGGRVNYARVTGEISEDVTILVETAESAQYKYIGEPVSVDADEYRVKIGKGLKSRYVYFGLEPYDGKVTLILNSFKLFGKPGKQDR